MNPRVNHPTPREVRHMATLTVLAFEKDKREENLFGNDLTNAAEYIYFNCLRGRLILNRAILPGRPEADQHIQRIITATKLVKRRNA